MQWIDASPVDSRWTGKAWGLNFGLLRSNPSSQWILCIDADVRIAPKLARSLLAHAIRTKISTFSLATRQHLSGAAEAFIHPSFLTTLIYRFGLPGLSLEIITRCKPMGNAFSCREILLRTDAFAAAQASLCEDITIARRLVKTGEAVGFHESDDLADARMYRDWRDTWTNWPRSLPMRDQYFGWPELFGLFEVLLVQGTPLPMLMVGLSLVLPAWLLVLNAILLTVRIGSWPAPPERILTALGHTGYRRSAIFPSPCASFKALCPDDIAGATVPIFVAAAARLNTWNDCIRANH